VSDDLPPFSGDNPMCRKCLHQDASTTYMGHGRCVHPDVAIGWEPNERLHRRCLRCGYQWDEAIYA
jgi:hypothetical protein